MTKDEAIRQIKEEIAEYEKGLTNCGDYFNQGCKVGLLMGLSIVQQIDEPPTPVGELHPNWTNWHTGDITEQGLYVCYWGTKNRVPYYTLTEVAAGTTIRPMAWQKIEPYEG